jgi:hypothetical protein
MEKMLSGVARESQQLHEKRKEEKKKTKEKK